MFYQKVMDQIRNKYEVMAKKSKVMKAKVRKWIGNYQKANKELQKKRTYDNSAETIKKNREAAQNITPEKNCN